MPASSKESESFRHPADLIRTIVGNVKAALHEDCPTMLTVTAADSSNRATALRLLFARFPVDEQASRFRDALAASEKGSLNLDGLLLATVGELPVGAALVMLQPDAITLVWPPVLSCGAMDEARIEDALMLEVCRRIDATEARLGQSLLMPDDVVEATLLARHGFAYAADIFFLVRAHQTLDAETATVSPEPDSLVVRHAVTSETFREDNASRFARVIEESYQHSLDCPYLKNFRNGAEALDSHKLSGVFDPASWWLYSIDGRDAGVLLLNEHPDQDAVELVYVGVIPEKRGLGLGRAMLRVGVRHAAQRGCAAMFLAVDSENHYANSLYSEFAFAELARRRVMIRPPNGLARQ